MAGGYCTGSLELECYFEISLKMSVFKQYKFIFHLQRSNQSILKETSLEYSLEGLTLELKLHYFGHLMWRTDSLEKTLMLAKIEGRRRRDGWTEENRGRDGWMASPIQWTWVWASSGNWWWTGKPGVLQSMGSQKVRHDWVTELNGTLDTKLFIFVLRNKQAFCQYGNVKEDPSAVLSLSGDTHSQTS